MNWMVVLHTTVLHGLTAVLAVCKARKCLCALSGGSVAGQKCGVTSWWDESVECVVWVYRRSSLCVSIGTGALIFAVGTLIALGNTLHVSMCGGHMPWGITEEAQSRPRVDPE